MAVGLLLGVGADVHAKDAAARMPLSYALSPDMVNILVRHGANLMATSVGGQTALHLAISEKRCGILSALLDAGMAASTPDAYGRNAMHMAVTAQDYGSKKERKM
jgi:ankyrin repeat protein